MGCDLEKNLTLDQFQRREWSLANHCFLCLSHEESIDHILLHCDKARVLWSFYSLPLEFFG